MSTKTSKKIFQFTLLLSTVVSLYFVPWPIVIAWIKPLPNTVQEQVNNAKKYGFDGIIVYVDKGSQKGTWYTAGYHNKETKVPTNPESLFKIASVGKLYNALAVAKLVRSGVLSLDQNLAFYLPDLKGRIENAEKITLRMIVQHRSGIPNYTDTPDYYMTIKETPEENLALILDHPASFKPDQDYEYSNTNYLLLEMIMSKKLGYSSSQYIKEKILMPMQLNDTYTSLDEVDMDRVMSGYYVGYKPDLKTDKIGSMLATAEDLGKFIRYLNDGSIFTDDNEHEIYSSIYKYEHTGLIPGYQTIAKYYKELNTVVIQFTNTVDFEGYHWNLSEVMYGRIVDILAKENTIESNYHLSEN